MTAGRMHERVRLERRQPAANDGYGNALAEWSTLATVWARIQPVTRGEAVLAGKLQGRRTVEITVRSSAAIRGVTTDDRAVDDRTGEIWNIRAAENRDERDVYVTFVAESGVAV